LAQLLTTIDGRAAATWRRTSSERSRSMVSRPRKAALMPAGHVACRGSDANWLVRPMTRMLAGAAVTPHHGTATGRRVNALA
jgi:hypothetical protein